MSSSVVLGIAIVRGEENLSNESVGTCKRGSYLVVGYKDWPCCFYCQLCRFLTKIRKRIVPNVIYIPRVIVNVVHHHLTVLISKG